MSNLESVLTKLEGKLSASRFKHSVGVMDTAGKLAKFFNANIEKSKLAGLVHDCAREIHPREQLKIAENFGILLDEIERLETVLIHGPLGAFIAKKDFKIKDEEILRAIKIHTTGDKNMTLLDKIIFIADYIEPSRNFPGVDIIRKQVCEDLDKAILTAIDSTISYVMDKGSLLHPKTVKARNFILIQRRRGERA